MAMPRLARLWPPAFRFGRASQAVSIPHRQEATAHYPRHLDTESPYRRTERVARAGWTLALASCGLNLILGAALLSLIPLQRVELALLTVSPAGNQVYRVEPLERDTEALRAATYAWVREYVETRLRIIPDEVAVADQVTWLRRRSSEQVFAEYREQMAPLVREAMQRGIARTAEVTAVTEQARGVYIVDVSLQTREREVDRGRETQRVVLRVAYLPQRLTAGELQRDRMINPFGFTVIAYTRQS